ncbi:N-acetylglucosamine-1-phosphate transferase subunits alpha and beta isoform X2 [Dermacentor variabilis]|uniref:N-acetylglucosamine-1-phosphate transferase subunits alpha and beta isoform X2 n=1 Tax=Dermacentor variabilis TaxID=34621 RepID=UPI003F5BF7B9
MRRNVFCKLLQRQTYNVLSEKRLCVVSLLAFAVFAVSALHFCEVAFDWSKTKYAAVFDRFRDNIAGENYQDRLCQDMPIDAVYTWVNGTDPELVRNLSLIRKQLMLEANKSSPAVCPFKMCVMSPILILKLDSNASSLPTVQDGEVERVFRLSHHLKEPHSLVALLYSSVDAAKQVASAGHTLVSGRNASVSVTFVTADTAASNTVPLDDMLMVSGISSGVSAHDVTEKLSYALQDGVVKVYMYEDESLALVVTSGKSATETLSKVNVSLKARLVTISRVSLVIDPLSENEDLVASRFADNDEIFPNKSHLPTYSSPAIETHLHRIRGLSQRFIYLNDDVFFGKEVWPEDFYTHAAGYKVRLAWPVPDCAMGCPTSWVKDGYCDKPCNNSKCEWDGGDCLGAAASATPRPFHLLPFPRPDLSKLYCSTSCANSWLADKFCDQACNVLPCAFDAGDCGTANYGQLYSLDLSWDEQNYSLPSGHILAYFNLSSFLGEGGSLTDGRYEENAAVRLVAVSVPSSVITVMIFPNSSATTVDMTVTGLHGGLSFEFKFSLTTGVDVPTKEVTTDVPSATAGSSPPQIPLAVTEETVNFTGYPDEMRYPPSPELLPDGEELYRYADVDVRRSMLPGELVQEIVEARVLYSTGLLTLKGFRKLKSQLIEQYARNATLVGDQEADFVFRQKGASSIVVVNETVSRPPQRALLGLREGWLPWEKQNLFGALMKRHLEVTTEPTKWRGRRLLDTFGDSLRHVNRLFNSAFGYETRKVPSHMAHMIDVEVMKRLQEKFPEEFDQTSSHRIRSPNDMQFAFSYFYFLMSEKHETQPEEHFDMFDVDKSGTWSDREIRTLVTRLFELPMEAANARQVEEHLTECAHNFTPANVPSTPSYERYLDSKLPTITKEAVMKCEPVLFLLRKASRTRPANHFETVKEEDYVFRMLNNNASRVLAQLDELRREPKKFICLNDNLDYSSKDLNLVRLVVHDFYESLFPTSSQFELPTEYRNRFLYVRELHAWRAERNWVYAVTYVAFGVLVAFTAVTFCSALRSNRKSCRSDNTCII